MMYPGLRPGLSSAVPAGLDIEMVVHSQASKTLISPPLLKHGSGCALPPRDVCGLYSLTMLSCRSNQRTHRSLWVALGFLCCALIVCASVVQVGHIHADGQSVRSDCA